MGSKRAIRRKAQRRMCGKKVRHETREDAQAAVIPTLKRGKKPGAGFLAPYRCQFCGKWHLGRKSGRARSILIAIERAVKSDRSS